MTVCARFNVWKMPDTHGHGHGHAYTPPSPAPPHIRPCRRPAPLMGCRNLPPADIVFPIF